MEKEREARKQRLLKENELIGKLDKLIERWLPIEGYDNYKVSSFGRVKNTTTRRILKAQTDKTWYVRIVINGKNTHIGLFENKDDAINARLQKANEVFKEFTHKDQKQ